MTSHKQTLINSVARFIRRSGTFCVISVQPSCANNVHKGFIFCLNEDPIKNCHSCGDESHMNVMNPTNTDRFFLRKMDCVERICCFWEGEGSGGGSLGLKRIEIKGQS